MLKFMQWQANDTGTFYNCNCMRDINVALIAITPFETLPRLQKTFNQ